MILGHHRHGRPAHALDGPSQTDRRHELSDGRTELVVAPTAPNPGRRCSTTSCSARNSRPNRPPPPGTARSRVGAPDGPRRAPPPGYDHAEPDEEKGDVRAAASNFEEGRRSVAAYHQDRQPRRTGDRSTSRGISTNRDGNRSMIGASSLWSPGWVVRRHRCGCQHCVAGAHREMVRDERPGAVRRRRWSPNGRVHQSGCAAADCVRDLSDCAVGEYFSNTSAGLALRFRGVRRWRASS